jgi:hypothetical protein
MVKDPSPKLWRQIEQRKSPCFMDCCPADSHHEVRLQHGRCRVESDQGGWLTSVREARQTLISLILARLLIVRCNRRMFGSTENDGAAKRPARLRKSNSPRMRHFVGGRRSGCESVMQRKVGEWGEEMKWPTQGLRANCLVLYWNDEWSMLLADARTSRYFITASLCVAWSSPNRVNGEKRTTTVMTTLMLSRQRSGL